MADLRTDFLGIKSPNPFWLASAPPTDRKVNVERAFRAGWGGVVWKTLGEAGPPIVNVSGARYGAIHGPDRRLRLLQLWSIAQESQAPHTTWRSSEQGWPQRAGCVPGWCDNRPLCPSALCPGDSSSHPGCRRVPPPSNRET